MIKIFNTKLLLKAICSRLRSWPPSSSSRRRAKAKAKAKAKARVVVKKFGRSVSSSSRNESLSSSSAVIHPSSAHKSIRIATFNAALFSMAPALPTTTTLDDFNKNLDDNHHNDYHYSSGKGGAKSMRVPPKSILKHDPISKHQKSAAKSRLRRRVSINLPDNEISLKRSEQQQLAADYNEEEEELEVVVEEGNIITSSSSSSKGKAPILRKSNSMHSYSMLGRSIFEVLKELDADVLALQDVKAEEEKNMKPLSDIADALGMKYVFAESWAPQYGNAILSKWPIKRWKVQKVCDDTDFRNVVKASIDVPEAGGEINIFCTHLDHLDENWRIKQINAIIHESRDVPHILAGGLNSLDETDYSQDRWTDIVKYYEETRKPTPKVEVMKYLKSSKEYRDAKDFAGECESVVMIAKGQSVQGTCKYGTRVDYILSSSESPYKFVPGSYSVSSSKGTSDHHIVKVDVMINNNLDDCTQKRIKALGRRSVVKITHDSSSQAKGIWKLHS